MPGITNPAEEYFKDGIWAWATNTWEKLISVGGLLHTALHGWDGAAWHKLPMVWGYTDRLFKETSSNTGAAGARSLSIIHNVVGEVWVLEQVAAQNANTAPTRIIIETTDGATGIPLVDGGVLTAGRWTTWHGRLTLKKDDVVNVLFVDCALDDTVFLRARGYIMKIAE